MQDAGENGAASGHLSTPGEEQPVSHSLQCFLEAFKRKARLYLENDSSIDKHMHENLKTSICLFVVTGCDIYVPNLASCKWNSWRALPVEVQ